MVSVLTQIKETQAANPIDRLLAATATDMAKVNALILSRADSHVEMVPDLARYLIESGGKRLRPMLTIASAMMCGYRGNGHIKLAGSVEFAKAAVGCCVHVATMRAE